jgi:cyclopropane fatty-acyl-phospholipid synthase-like methyltransferase
MAAIEHWNERYAGEDYLFGEEPNAFLRSHAARLRPASRILAVADGEGRNGVWLAGQGHSVTSVEASPVALEKARRLAIKRGAHIDTIQADLSDWVWPREAYDCVVAIFIQFAGPELRARIFEAMIGALRSGGQLFLQGYRSEQLANGTGGPRIAENLYTERLLRDAFSALEIVELRTHDSILQEGAAHVGPSALIDLVAVRPI